MAVFKARVDMVDAHRGHAGHRPGHLQDTFDRILLEKSVTMDMVLKWSPEDQEALKKEVEEAASEEYLAVLFIKQVDEIWYGDLKTALADAYLNLTTTEYGFSTTLQITLRLLKGYTLIRSNRRQHNNNNNKDGVAFVEQQQDWSDKHCSGCVKRATKSANVGAS